MSDQNLQNAQKALLEIEYENYGTIGDLFRGKGSWEIFYCEEASEDGYVAIEADDYIAEFNGDISGQAVCVQFMLSADEETYGLLYADLDGKPLDGDEATELLAKLAGGRSGGRRAGGERKSSSRFQSDGTRPSSGRSNRSGGSGHSGSRRTSDGGRKSSARSGENGGKSKAETAALEAWCEENGYEYSEEYWEEFEESEEYEEYLDEYEDDDAYDDDEAYEDDEAYDDGDDYEEDDDDGGDDYDDGGDYDEEE